MVDITKKSVSLRMAKGVGRVYCMKKTLDCIRENKVPKGDIYTYAKSAGMLGAKATSSLIPHCHPVRVDNLEIAFNLYEEGERGVVEVQCAGKSLDRTGIEMEVLTGLTVSCLTIYDILKPIDEELEISGIKLLEKRGGKGEMGKSLYIKEGIKAGVLVCSDSTASGRREDKSGKIIKEQLEKAKAKVLYYTIIPDEKEEIQKTIKSWIERGEISYIFTTGGTGLGPRDKTVEAVEELIEREAQGISERIRAYGGERTPLAMFSRGVTGTIGKTLVITLPGSSAGAREGMEAILPWIFHAKKMLGGGGH